MEKLNSRCGQGEQEIMDNLEMEQMIGDDLSVGLENLKRLFEK